MVQCSTKFKKRVILARPLALACVLKDGHFERTRHFLKLENLLP